MWKRQKGRWGIKVGQEEKEKKLENREEEKGGKEKGRKVSDEEKE